MSEKYSEIYDTPRVLFGLLVVGCWCVAMAQQPAAKKRSATPASTSKATSTAAAQSTAFQSALALYQKGDFKEAAVQLETLLHRLPKSAEAHELLGLTYAAQARMADAVQQLQAAVTLNPKSVPAENNLAASLMHAGKPQQAVAEYRKALALDAQDYEANRSLAGLYLQANRIADAMPLLERARRARPDAYDNGYDLALAYLLMDRPAESRHLVETLIQQKPSGELHTLLGRINERQGRYLDAAKEFEEAAHLDPSEDNLFVWASELLLHRTYVPAIEIFRQASARYPQSPRLLIGLGMSLYARGEYEEAIRSLVKAADLDPRDRRCFLYLSKAFLSSPSQADDAIERFRRYAELEPGNSLAQYYYAISLWKGKRLESQGVDYAAVESLLKKSIALDDAFADAHLQLGILYTDQHAYDKAFPEYQRALQLAPNSADAHFRMGRYYLHAGEKAKAEGELGIFKSLQAKHQAEEDKARAEVQQFVVSAGTAPATP